LTGLPRVEELLIWTWDLSHHLANICNQQMARQGTELSCCL